jgi:hypothetical protein
MDPNRRISDTGVATCFDAVERALVDALVARRRGDVRAQLEQATRRWDADRTGADRKAFDTMTRMRRFEFALEMLGTPERKARPQRRRALH